MLLSMLLSNDSYPGDDVAETQSDQWHLRICICIALAVFMVYGQIITHEFVRYDDHHYVFENKNVKQGLTPDSIIWAFTAFYASNWHPLTWLSHITDCHFYGLNPGMHHLSSLLFHILNSILLFTVFRKLDGRIWQSAFIAALFAVHPLHVESVAWISERKDLLSTFFWLLTIWAYIRYVRQPKPGAYLLVILMFICGLMSKPMVVTLPCVLLLLDYYPLRRSHPFKLLIEKIPFFILSVISGIITIIAQKEGGAISDPSVYPLGFRLANTALSYVLYLWKTAFPFNLAVFYPHPETIPLWQSAGAVMILAAVSALSIRLAKSHPFLIVGWLWYLGTLLPVIGILKVGDQAMADRYTYIPHIGIFMMLSYGVPYLIKKRDILKITAYGFIFFCMVITYFQVRHWKNTLTLFEHAVNVTRNNFIAHSNLGNYYAAKGEFDKALPHFLKASEIKPNDFGIINHLGNFFANMGNAKQAAYYFSEAIRLAPDDAETRYKLGTMLMRLGDPDKAIAQFSYAISINSDYAEAHNDLGVALVQLGKIDKAAEHFSIALRLRPEDREFRRNWERISAMNPVK